MRSPSPNLKYFCAGSPYPVLGAMSLMRVTYAEPRLVKKTTFSLVEPGSTNSTSSPSRTRVCPGSLSSRTRLSQPARVTTTLAFILEEDERLGVELDLLGS